MWLRVKEFWNGYWFSRESAVGFAIFRVGLGIIFLIYHLPRLFYIADLYTEAGYIVPFHILGLLPLPTPNLPAAAFLNLLLVIAIFFFILGLYTRAATVALFILHTYLSWLENFSMRGFGQIMTVYSLLAVFAPMGSALSVDAARQTFKELKNRTRDLGAKISMPLAPVTMQKIMLWQLVSIYFFNVLSKMYTGGLHWLAGTNVINIYYDPRYGRDFMVPLLEKITWALPILGNLILLGLILMTITLVRRRDRKYAIAFGIFYHGFALVTMKVPYVFSLLMFTLYIIAVEPETWARIWDNFRKMVSRIPAKVFYDGTCNFCRLSVSWVKAFDFAGKFEFIDADDPHQGDVLRWFAEEKQKGTLLDAIRLVAPDQKTYQGFFAFRKMLQYLPHGWLLLPPLYLPGASVIGARVYSSIARRRYGICQSCV